MTKASLRAAGVLSLSSLLLGSTAAAGELRGRIVIADKPVAGAAVSAIPSETPFEEARREARRQAPPAPLSRAVTGQDGSFALSVPADPANPARTFRLMAEGGGIAPRMTAGVFDSSDTEDLGDLALPRAGRLVGRVVDEKGAPVAGAEVRLGAGASGAFLDMADTASVPRVTLTGADGSFRFEEASPTGNRLWIEARGFAYAEFTGLREGAMARPIVLAPGIALSGVLRAPDRKAPAAGALVRFEGKARSRWTEAGRDGGFRLADLPAGSGTLVADGGEAGIAEVPGLTLPGSEAQRREVVLQAGASIEGRVVNAASGAAIPRVKLSVRSGGATAVVRSGSDGRYRVSGLAAGRYRVDADDPRHVAWSRTGVTLLVGQSQKVDVPLQPAAAMTGRVIDENGAPIAGARGTVARGGEAAIMVLMREGPGRQSWGFRSGPDGSFKATRLPAGDNLRLTVTHSEHERRILPGLSLAAGATKSGVTIVMQRGLSLTGVVKDDQGQPIGGAEATLFRQQTFRGGRGGTQMVMSFIGGPEAMPRATSGPDGRFEIKGLSGAERVDYRLTVRKDGYADAIVSPVTVAPESEAIEVTLPTGATISGTVLDGSGNPAEGVYVQARPRDGRPEMGLRGGMREATGPDGFFLIDGLKPGEQYDLVAMGGDPFSAPRRDAVTAPADGVELRVAGSGRIAGKVVDAQSGRPVTDFEVSFSPDRSGRGGGAMVIRMAAGGRRRGMGERQQVHAEDGSFVLEDVSPGTWEVNVEGRGFQRARVGGIVVEAGKTREGVEVKLAAGSMIRGRVVDARSGRGIPDARINAGTAGGGPGPGALAMFGQGGGIATDADGMFEVDGLSPGKYVVEAQHPEYSEASLLVEVGTGVTPAELKLSAGGGLAGTVLSETRRPLAGAEVSLSPTGEGGPGRGPMFEGQGTVTDEAGRFRFDHLNAGRYRLVAAVRERSSTPLDVVLQASETKEDVVIALAAGATIRGLVSGLPDAMRAGINVTASGTESYFSMVRTGSDGSFEFGGVPVGPVMLRAMAGDFLSGSQRSASAQVSVAEGQAELSAEIVFETGFTLSGTVTRGGSPVADATVSANLRGQGRSASGRADASGNYRLEGLQEGTYTVVASLGFGGSPRIQEVKIAGDTTLDLVIPTARLAGSVVEATMKQPLADARVEVEAGDAAVPFRRVAITDSSGRFALEDLDPKAYTVTVSKPGFQFEKRSITAQEEGSDDLVLELRRGEGVGLVVRDGIFGVPLRGVMARALDAQGTSVYTGTVNLDSEGRGEIPSLRPGRYAILLDADGYAPVTLEAVDVPAPQVAVMMTPGGAVELHCGPTTLASGSATIRFLKPNGAPYLFSIFSMNGRIVVSAPLRRLENFAPGRYQLVVENGPTKEFAVAEGGVTVVELP